MLAFKTNLLPHQQKCFNKLSKYRVGAMYMEMGTGKTRTMLEIIKDKYDKNKIDKVIWLCPCSAKENIKIDLEKHILSGKNIFIIAGIESLSSSVSLNSFLLEYVQNNRCLIVVDESIKIKNIRAIRTKNIIRLGEYCNYRYILNGSPISRDEQDLFGQWYFLDWRILGYRSVYTFRNKHVIEKETRHGKMEKIVNADILTKKIAPYTYQIKKDEVLKLPPKKYYEEYFWLDDEHYEKYIEISEYFIGMIDEDIPETIYRMFSHLLNTTSGYYYDIVDNKPLKKKFYENPEDNPRIKKLLEVVEYTYPDKVIIFCEFKSEIDDIIDILSKKYGGEKVCRFDGSVSIKKRNDAVNRFKNKAIFFVANKDCAGYSLNLQFCNTVIYYNNDWDYATRSQSEDRVHRIGQKGKVKYIDIIAADTLEIKVQECLSRKIDLTNWFKKSLATFTKKDIKKMLYNKEVEEIYDKDI